MITLEQREAYRAAYGAAMQARDMAKANAIAKEWGSVELEGRQSTVYNADWVEKRKEILARDGGRCVKCASTERVQVDHIVPVSRGGSEFDNANLQTLCRPCHKEKTRQELIRRHEEYGY